MVSDPGGSVEEFNVNNLMVILVGNFDNSKYIVCYSDMRIRRANMGEGIHQGISSCCALEWTLAGKQTEPSLCSLPRFGL